MMNKEEEVKQVLNIYQKLQKVQQDLKAPKGQFNSFGKYKYRNCEDILEAVKPVLNEYQAAIVIDDVVTLIGDRYYIKATATFIDITNGEKLSASASARESENKKGMDDSQITGTASSYARKYALNGLLLIDDTKDSDTDENHKQTNQPTKKVEVQKSLTLKKTQLEVDMISLGIDITHPQVEKVILENMVAYDMNNLDNSGTQHLINIYQSFIDKKTKKAEEK